MSKKPMPMTDNAFSLVLAGRVKDDGNSVNLAFNMGTKNSGITAFRLAKDGSTFKQAFLSHLDMRAVATTIEGIALHPGEGKIARTIDVLKYGSPKPVPSGLKIIVSRRSDGLVSIRLEHWNIREAIFPVVLEQSVTSETRVEGGEPYDRRMQYRLEAIDYANFLRSRSALWIDRATAEGKVEMRERLNGSSSWG